MGFDFTFWFKAAAIMQLLTGVFHSLSFFSKPAASNETEERLLDLFYNYKRYLGLGISRSVSELFLAVSICFTLLCFFAGAINLLLIHQAFGSELRRGVFVINLICFTILFIVMVRYTFVPPIVLTGLILFCLVMAWFCR